MTTATQTKNSSIPTKKPQQPVGEAMLKDKKYFTVKFLDGEEIECKLLQWGVYDFSVETEMGTLLIPKHAVKYYIVDRIED